MSPDKEFRDALDLWRGLRVVWRHSPRGGYGYVIRIPATVVSATRNRVIVDVKLADGTIVRRTVPLKSLCNIRRGE